MHWMTKFSTVDDFFRLQNYSCKYFVVLFYFSKKDLYIYDIEIKMN